MKVMALRLTVLALVAAAGACSKPRDLATAQSMCAANDVEACLDLVHFHWDGTVTGWIDMAEGNKALERAVAIDKERAIAVTTKACNRDKGSACARLGVMHQRGLGTPVDLKRAEESQVKACSRRYWLGCVQLAELRSFAATLAPIQVACEKGYGPACREWATFPSYSGVTKEKAAEMLHKACEGTDGVGKYAKACGDLGHHYRLQHDDTRAVQFYTQACEHGAPDRCDDLAGFYVEGKGVAKDLAKAIELYKVTCAVEKNCYPLRGIYADTKDYTRLIPLLQAECDGGNVATCRELGEMYEKGDGVARDVAKAIALYGKACKGLEYASCHEKERLERTRVK